MSISEQLTDMTRQENSLDGSMFGEILDGLISIDEIEILPVLGMGMGDECTCRQPWAALTPPPQCEPCTREKLRETIAMLFGVPEHLLA